MPYSDPIDSYSGAISELTFGTKKKVSIGGENCLPFYTFEGNMPNPPLLALEVWDVAPTDWPAALNEIYSDVYSDAAAWAKRCEELGADAVMLTLVSTDPNGLDRSPEEAAETVGNVLSVISVPLIVYGTGNIQKDAEVLKRVAERNSGADFLLGFAQEDNYKTIAASGMGFNKPVVGQTPLDVNLAKQLNILMTQLGMDPSRIVMDPTTGCLGYGLEYCYSVLERLKIAALKQGDKMTAMPIINVVGQEVWKIKENKISFEEDPTIGDPRERGIAWETITAMALAIAGSNILVLRHPRSIEILKGIFQRMM